MRNRRLGTKVLQDNDKLVTLAFHKRSSLSLNPEGLGRWKMRATSLLLATVLMFGCGYGSRNYNPGMTGGGSAPSIATLSPSSAMHGGSGFTLTINGSNFGTDAAVYWNGVAQATMYVTGNQVTAAITASDVANTGMVPVYVRSGGQNSNTVNFDVQ